MSASHLSLIIISSLGVVHGLFLSVFIWSHKAGNHLSNRLLSLLLFTLSFRVGKSLFLEFTPELDTKFIFIGLGTLMMIGPLFYLYTQSYLVKGFKIASKHLLHFVPALLGVCFGFWIEGADLEILPRALFFTLFMLYYMHYLCYLLLGYFLISKKKKEEGSHSITLTWIRLIFWGLLIIWVAYVLNLFDRQVPYILGPILYSLVAYSLSFIAIRNGYLQKIDFPKYKTNPISDAQQDTLFEKVKQFVIADRHFKNSDLTLKSLSKELKVSTQVLSLVINKKSKVNFNTFINSHRVQEAVKLFNDSSYHHRTVSSIALEVGFNSVSSFNTAFKKEVHKTPQEYRKALTK